VAVLIVTMISLEGISSDVHTLAENDLPATSLLLNIDRDAYQAELGLERYVGEEDAEHAATALDDFTTNAAQTEERFLLYEEAAVGAEGEAAEADLFWAARDEWVAAAENVIALRDAGYTITDPELQTAKSSPSSKQPLERSRTYPQLRTKPTAAPATVSPKSSRPSLR
jgi:hypothetical protein